MQINNSSHRADEGLKQNYSMVRAGAALITHAHHFEIFTDIAFSSAAMRNENISGDVYLPENNKLIDQQYAEEVSRQTSQDVIDSGKRIIDASLDSHLLALL